MQKQYKKMIIKVVLGIIGLGILTLIIINEIQMRKAVIILANRVNIMDEFLSKTFPDQVKTYTDGIKALQNNQIPQ